MSSAERSPLHVLDGVLIWPPETFLQRKFAALARRGVEVTVISTVPRSGARVHVEGAELLRIPSSREPRALLALRLVAAAAALLVTRPRRLWALFRATARPRPPAHHHTPPLEMLYLLARYLPLARCDPDLVHFEWETSVAHFLPLTEVWECPLVVSCRGREIHAYGHLPGNEQWVGRLPAAFERAAVVHCVSDAIARESEHYGVDPAKVRVIRPAVDPDVFSPGPAGTRADGDARVDGELRLIGVGELIWPKGWEYALHAVYLLAREGIPAHLDIVGGIRTGALGFEERHRIDETIADLGLEDRVTLRGPLDPDAVLERLRASDVFVHASLCEGIPNVVLEAMACGLPVVVTDAGGTAEAVRDGRDGLVVPRRDSHALAAAVRSLWDDPELRRRLGGAARERIRSDFTLDQQVESIVRLYDEAMGA